MRDESFLANDLEILKIAARETRQGLDRANSKSKTNSNRTDIVHAGYRFLQCISAAIVFIFHVVVDVTEKLPGLWDLTFVAIYPCCFFASLILAVTRIMNFVPNPTPIIPVTISVTGWLAMLAGAILAMRHAELNLDVVTMSDDELAMSPIFKHDLMLCALSILGSSIYLVHAWLCFDCWQWEKRVKKMQQANPDSAKTSSPSSAESLKQSDSGMSSNDGTEPNFQTDGPEFALPGTSRGQDKPLHGIRRYRNLSVKASRLFNKLRKKPNAVVGPDENDPFATLNEILHGAVHVEQIKVEDEPVRLYCCCVDLRNMIKHEYMTNLPVHEFQVVQVM